MYVCDLCPKKKKEYPGKSGLLVHIRSVHGNYCKFMEEMDKKQMKKGKYLFSVLKKKKKMNMICPNYKCIIISSTTYIGQN